LGSNPVVPLQGKLCFKRKEKRSSINIALAPVLVRKGALERERERALFKLWSVSMGEGTFWVLVLRERENCSGFAFWI
jgi:hypothetical protein